VYNMKKRMRKLVHWHGVSVGAGCEELVTFGRLDCQPSSFRFQITFPVMGSSGHCDRFHIYHNPSIQWFLINYTTVVLLTPALADSSS
jgi:hypothetical protein